MRSKKLWLALLIAVLALVVFASPAMADDPDDPDSVSLHDMSVYRNLLEDDDYMAIVPYSVPYTSLPDENIDKLYIFRMIDTDGTSNLGTVLAYPYPSTTQGYGDGIVSFYFAADDAPTWDTVYTIRVEQNLVYFETPSSWAFYLPTSAYTSDDTQSGNQALLKSEVIAIAQELSITWSVDLLEESEVATVLSEYGEAYFRNSIFGLQTMCPDLFSVQLEPLTPDSRLWDTTFADSFKTKYDGTFWGNAMTGFAGLLNVETSPAATIMGLLLIVVIMGVARLKLKLTVSSAWLHGFAALLLVTLLGMFSFLIHGLIAFVCSMIAGVVLFLNRA